MIFLKNSFFPSAVIESLNRTSLKKIFKNQKFLISLKNILKFIRASQNSVHNCHNPKEIKSLDLILRLDLRED